MGRDREFVTESMTDGQFRDLLTERMKAHGLIYTEEQCRDYNYCGTPTYGHIEFGDGLVEQYTKPKKLRQTFFGFE